MFPLTKSEPNFHLVDAMIVTTTQCIRHQMILCAFLLIIIIIQQHSTTCTSQIINNQANNDDHDADATKLNGCIDKIIEKYVQPHELLLVWDGGNWNQHCYSIIRRNFGEMEQFYYRKVDFYLIYLDHHNRQRNNDLQDILRTLSSDYKMFNSRSKFLIIVSRLVSTDLILNQLNANYIFNVVIIDKSNNNSMYTYYPYLHEDIAVGSEATSVLTPVLLVPNCSIKIENTVDLYPNKIPNKWRNSTINITYLLVPPFVICPECTKPLQKGLEISIFEVIRSRMGFQVNYVKSKHQTWGIQISHGLFSGAASQIATNRTVAAFGSFLGKSDKYMKFDMSVGTVEDTMYWIAPKTDYLKQWKNVLFVLSASVTYSTIGSMLLVSVAIYWMSQLDLFNIKIMHSCTVHFITILLELYAMIFGKTITFYRVSIKIQIILMCWTLLSLIVTTSYTSNLIYFLTSNKHEHQIDSLEEILDASDQLTIGIRPDVLQLYQDSDFAIYKRILQQHEICENASMHCLNHTAFDKNMATHASESAVNYFVSQFYIDDDGVALIHRTHTPIIYFYVHWYFIKGHPMFQQINHLLLHLKSNGVIQEITTLYNFYISWNYNSAMGKYIDKHVGALDLHQIQGVFYLLMCGLVGSCVVFFVEIIRCKISLRTNSK